MNRHRYRHQELHASMGPDELAPLHPRATSSASQVAMAMPGFVIELAAAYRANVMMQGGVTIVVATR